MGAPMAGVSGGKLAAAVDAAGGLGFIAGGHLPNQDFLSAQISEGAKAGTQKPSFGIIGFSALADGNFDRLAAALDAHKPKVVQMCAVSNWGCGAVELCKQSGALVFAQVGTVAGAKEALAAGVDAVIAQGREAGGHGVRSELGSGTLPLAARIVELARGNEAWKDKVVLAAGGIVDGRGVAAALALGCDGAVLGTRLWASAEALADPTGAKRAALEKAEADDVIRTAAFDILQDVGSPTPWPAPWNSVGALQNETTTQWHDKEQELRAAVSVAGGGAAAAAAAAEPPPVLAEFRAAAGAGDLTKICCYAGEGVGGIITAAESATDIVTRVEAEAIAAIQASASLITE